VRELTRLVYADELRDAFEATWSERTIFLDNVLADRDGQGRWCDHTGTPAIESCAELCARAFELALGDLRARYGADSQQWSWGSAHRAVSAHIPFSSVPGLGRYFGLSVPSPGDNQSVNLGGYDLSDDEQPFASSVGPTYRALYDLGDPEASLFISSAGQSGHFLSQHYADFSRRWSRGEYVPMRTKRSDVEAGSIGVLILHPE
jgi:penicillin amidase